MIKFFFSILLLIQVSSYCFINTEKISSKDDNKSNDLRISVGVNPSLNRNLRDYLYPFATGENKPSDFSTFFEIAGEYGYELTKNSQIGLEVNYEFNSYEYDNIFSASKFRFKIDYLSPSINYYLIIKKPTYKVKIGGGIGPRFCFVSQNLYTTKEISYKSSGYGISLKIDGSTLFSQNLFLFIGGDVRYNIIGKLEDNNKNNLKFWGSSENLDFSILTFSIKIGFTYNF